MKKNITLFKDKKLEFDIYTKKIAYIFSFLLNFFLLAIKKDEDFIKPH